MVTPNSYPPEKDETLTSPNSVTPNSKLSGPVVANILVITIVGIVSILLMLFGEFEHKWGRLFSTLLVFAVFTFGSYWKNKVDAGVSIVQIGNSYMLALSLLLIWVEFKPADPYAGLGIVGGTISIVGVTQLSILATIALFKTISSPHPPVSGVAKIAVAGMAVTTVLYTLPTGFNGLDFGETYWKLCLAAVLLTALAISVMCILIWAFSAMNKSDRSKEGKPSAASYAVPPTLPEKPATALPFQPEVIAPPPPPLAPPVGVDPWPFLPNGHPVPANADGSPNYTALLDAAVYLWDRTKR